MKILYGTEIKEELEQEIKNKLLKNPNIIFYLYSNLNCSDSQSYLNSIKKLLDKFNVEYKEDYYNFNKSEDDNLKVFKENARKYKTLFARPIEGINENKFIESIPVENDIDRLSSISRGKLFSGDLNYLPATVKSVYKIISHYNIDVFKKNVLVFGRSLSVGLPCFYLMQKLNATVTLLHSKSSKESIEKLTKIADIIILATGKVNVIDRKLYNPNQIVIDCGYVKNSGDLGFIPNDRELFAYTPVPKGVGSLTSLFLLLNALS